MSSPDIQKELSQAHDRVKHLTGVVESLVAQMNQHGIKPKIRMLQISGAEMHTPVPRKQRKRRKHMTIAMAAWIIERLEAGHKQRDIALEMDVSESAVSDIKLGKWKPRSVKVKTA